MEREIIDTEGVHHRKVTFLLPLIRKEKMKEELHYRPVR